MDHAPSFDRVGVREAPYDRRRRRGLLAVLLALTAISLGAGMFTLAVFTDSDDVGGTFASGTIDIAASPDIAFAVTDMVPGDTETAALTVANDGTAELRYALGVVASDALGDALTVEIRSAGTSCAAFDGAVLLASTTLDGAALGDPAAGGDAGDRTLAAAASEVLCVRVALPLATGNALQGASSSATISFDAEQTTNNP